MVGPNTRWRRTVRMRVYRLERNGIGPFSQGDARYPVSSLKKSKRAQHIQNQTIEHYSDIKLSTRVSNKYLYGASSKEMLKAYFRYNLQHYFKKGYRIKSYEVPKKFVIDFGPELAFPVRYHKLKTKENIDKTY